MGKKIFSFAFLLSVFLLSCSPNPNPENKPVVPLISSGSRCPEATMFPTPTHSKKAIYILLDNSGSYEYYFTDAAQRLQEVLVQILWPGDFVGIGLIGQESADMVIPNTVFEYPNEPIPPSYIPTLTPLPDSAIGSDLQQHEIESGYIVRENEERRDEYYCSIEEWNNLFDLSASQKNNAQIFQMISDSIPRQSQAEPSTDIQSALYNAHDFFGQARKLGYTNLKLIIFSDMVETEPPEEWVTAIDLSGVSVVVAMVPFDTNSDEVAGYIQSKQEWTTWFKAYRATDFEILTVPNSSTPLLVSYLEK